jgi:hypothetical protein
MVCCTLSCCLGSGSRRCLGVNEAKSRRPIGALPIYFCIMGAEMNRVVITPLGQSPKIVYNVVPDSQLNAGKFVCDAREKQVFPTYLRPMLQYYPV